MFKFLAACRDRKFSLQVLLVAPFVLQIVVAVGLTGWISLRNGQKAVHELANQVRGEASSRITTHLNHYLSVSHKINQMNLEAMELGILNLNDLNTVGRFFWKQMTIFDVGYINFGGVDGRFIGVERLPGGGLEILETQPQTRQKLTTYVTDDQGRRVRIAQVQTGYDMTQEGWYVDAMRSQRPVWSQIYQWQDKPNVLSISSSYPVFDNKGKLMGVMGVDLVLTQISNYLNQIRISPSSQVLLLEADGAVVATSTQEPLYRLDRLKKAHRLYASNSDHPVTRAVARHLQEALPNWQSLNQEQQFSVEAAGDRQFVRITPWRDALGLNWWVVVVVPESDFMGTIYENTRVTVVLCVAALFISTGLGILTVRRLVRPILHTIQAADALSKGHWQERLPETHSNELTALAQAFNRMAGQLQSSFARLEYSAYRDTLTGLLNRKAFQRVLEAAIARHATFQEDWSNAAAKLSVELERPLFAVLFLDLDYFKQVNDGLGHLIGDQLLMSVGQRLGQCVRSTDAIARFGGDEFVILLDPIVGVAEVVQVVERISQRLQETFELQGHRVNISASIGIVLSTVATEAPEKLLSYADQALYRAKAKGKATYDFFDSESGDGESGDGESGDGESGDGESGDGESGDGESLNLNPAA